MDVRRSMQWEREIDKKRKGLTDYDKLLAATLSSAFEQKQEILLFLYNLQNNFCALKPFVTPIFFLGTNIFVGSGFVRRMVGFEVPNLYAFMWAFTNENLQKTKINS